MRRRTIIVGCLLVIASTAPGAQAAPARPGPVDPHASAATRRLLRNLQDAGDPDRGAGLMFGQQHANWDSKREQLEDGRWRDWRAHGVGLDELNTFPSDIELAASLFTETTGNKPSVYGFNLQLALNVSAAQRHVYARQVVAAYATGAVVTMHFPADNPTIGGDNNVVGGNPMCHLSTDWSNPPAESAATIANWTNELQRVSAFIDEINALWRDPDLDGVREREGTVAIVLRPFHEMTGISHWWAGRFFRSDARLCNVTPAQAYRMMWRRTVDFIVGSDDPATPEVEGLDRHEFLFAWSPGRPTMTPGWRKYHPNLRLPGRWGQDDYVDIAGLNIYETSLVAFRRQLEIDITAMHELVADQMSTERDVLAITEFGARDGLAGRVDVDWYAGGLLGTLADAGVLEEIAYAMTWTNRTPEQFWVPVPCFNTPGCPRLVGFDQRFVGSAAPQSADWGFSEFIASPLTTLQRDLPDWWRMPELRVEPYIPCIDPGALGPAATIPCAR